MFKWIPYFLNALVVIGICVIVIAVCVSFIVPLTYEKSTVETQVRYISVGSNFFGSHPILITDNGEYDLYNRELSSSASFKMAEYMPKNTTIILKLENNQVYAWDIKR